MPRALAETLATTRADLAAAHAELDILKIQIGELRSLVFGTRKRPPPGGAEE